MRLDIVSPPAAEPVSLAEAKGHLRVDLDFDADDDLISRQIQSARIKCEAYARQAFVTTGFELYLDGFPIRYGFHATALARQNVIELGVCPLIAVESITYLDDDDVEQTLDPSTYRVLPGKPGAIQLRRLETWPSCPPQLDAVCVRFTAGYGAAADVPAPAKDAILITLANPYANRGEEPTELSGVAKDLLHSIMMRRRA